MPTTVFTRAPTAHCRCARTPTFSTSPALTRKRAVLLLYPDAHDEKMREILFVRQPNELLATWEGHKLTKEEATKISGIKRVEWLSEFRSLFHRLMCECEQVYLNANEHGRAVIEVESRDARFIRGYPGSLSTA